MLDKKSALLGCALTLGLLAYFAAAPLATAQVSAVSPAYDIDLPAQPLAGALSALSRQTGIQIFAAGDVIAGRRSAPVSGRLTVREALQRLLAGSGLEARAGEGGAFTVLRASSAALPDQSLPEVKVVSTGEIGLQPRKTSTLGPLSTLPLLDAPYSVNVIPPEMLRNENPTRLTEALRYVPGVVNNQPGGSYYDQVMVRGFDLSNLSNYRKNSLPLIIRGDTGFENIEQLELYKGPSAMFYGFSSPGGVINYITKRPPESGFLAGVQAGLNQYGGWRASGDVGGRFGPAGELGYRANLGYEDLANHIDGFKGRRDIESIAVDWRMADRTLLQFDFDRQYKRTHIQPGIGALNAAQIPDSVDPRKFLGQQWTYHIAESNNAIVQLTQALNEDWSLRVAGNYTGLERPYKFSNVQLDNKVTGAGLAFGGQLDQYYAAWAGVLQLDGKVRTGPIRHELIIGYSPQRLVYDEHRVFFAPAPFNIYNPPVLAEPVGALGPLRRTTFTNRSAYLMDRLSFSEHWQAVLGARYNDFAQTFTGQPDYERTKITPTVGLVFKPRSHVSLYASYMEGLERGGLAPTTAVNAGELMPPLLSKQYEAGVKVDLARGVSLTAAYFDISRPSEFANAARVWVQDGKQVSKGFELGIAGSATRDLSLYGGITVLDAKLEETGSPALNGTTPAGVPEKAASLYADYRIPGLSGWSVNGGVIHIGERKVFTDNSGSVPSYTLLNLGVRYEFKAGRGRARILLNVDNVTDQFYWDTVDSFGTLTIGVPRTVRLVAQFDY